MTLLGAVKSPSHNILTTVCDLPKLQLCSSEWLSAGHCNSPPTPQKPNCCYPEFSATEAASRKHTSSTLYWLGWGVGGATKHTKPWLLQQQQWWGGAMFLINGLHKLFKEELHNQEHEMVC